MLQLSRQARHTLRSPFICTSCRSLLASGATRLPGAVAKLCAARHYSTEQPIQQESSQSSPSSPSPQSAQEPQQTPESETQNNQSSSRKKTRRGPGRGKTASPASRHQLWRETLKVLKELKADPRPFPSAAASDQPPTSDTKPDEDLDTKSPSRKPPSSESRESKLVEGALVVLKRVIRQELNDAPEVAKETAKPERARKPSNATPEVQAASPAPVAPTTPVAPSQEKAIEVKEPKPASAGKGFNSPPTPPPALKPLAPLIPKTGKKNRKFTVERVNASAIQLTPVVKPQPPVPKLAYDLDRVLFNPGVYALQDPRSRVYNFDPYLARIMPIEDFDFNALKQYITSSKDNTLIETAIEHDKKYTGSTSSMTSTLAHFHYLLSAWRPINPSMLSREITIDSTNFTRINRAPAATFLHWKDGTYAIDADKEFDTANVLSMLGKSMEKFLTLPKEEFEKYRKTRSDELTDEERNGPESYHYTTLGDFMMRSQLDAYDPRLPGTGMFDLKTRAVVSIRMDAQDIEKGMGYEIRNRHGQWESFEREYYDMIRSAFMKYSLQVRMGRMDGIFVAFHNTERIFGFQYISLQEMDRSIHGQKVRHLGDREFKLSVHLLNKVLDRITAKYPGKSLRLHFETRPGDTPFMYIFAKPVDAAEIEKVQGARLAAVDEFERRMMGIKRGPETGLEEEEGEEAAEEAIEEDLDEELDEPEIEKKLGVDTWEDVMLKVENELEDEEHGVTFVREAIENALQESGLLRTTAPEETNRYIDSFLEALTNNSGSASAAVQGEPSKSVEVEHETESGDTPSSTSATKDAVQDSGKEGADSVESHVGEPTLKDMIVRLASQVKASRSQGEGQGEGVSAEELKLRKIEKILAELVDKPQDDGDVKKNKVVETGTVTAEPAEEAEQAVKTAAEPAAPSEHPAPAPVETIGQDDEVYGLILTVRNKVDDEYVLRPENMSRDKKWVVEYAMEEIGEDRAKTLYQMVLKRRQKLLDPDRVEKENEQRWYNMFRGRLLKYSQKGRKFRQRENDRQRANPVHVYGAGKPYTWESVFENKDDGTKPYEEWRPAEPKKELEEDPEVEAQLKARKLKEAEARRKEEEAAQKGEEPQSKE